MTDPLSRRDALALAGTALTGTFAGCQSGDDDGDPTDATTTDRSDVSTGGPPSDSPTATRVDGETPGPGTTPTDSEPTPSPGNSGSTTDTGSQGTVSLDGLSVRAERMASGFTSPIGIEIPRSERRFIVDQAGVIRLQDEDGLHDEPFLDVTDRMEPVSGYSEKGLLGLAFHPDFEENGRFFVRYSASNRPGTPGTWSHTFVLSEFHAEPGARRADPDSERTILEIPQPQRNHNAGDVAFGPDGYLYVTVGDGGGANDVGTGHVSDWYGDTGGGNGQDVTENLLGSVLRIDVDDRESDRNYAIPGDNPLVGREGLDEHYAWGFRNPWRLSFGPDGRLFVADVGQNEWEEIDVVEWGGNYGWNVREGTHCFGADDCPDESPRGRPLRDPVVEYPHGGAEVNGISVTGGYLYDGDDLPAFRGLYLFADWRSGGQLFAAREADEGLWPTTTVPVSSDEPFGPRVLSFGRDPAGELYVCTSANSQVDGNSGAVFRLRSN